MAVLTKGQVRTMVRSLLNNEPSVFISDAILDNFIGLTYDELFRSILTLNPNYNSVTTILTNFSPPGIIDTINDLVGSGVGRFHRLHSLVIDSRTYAEVDPRDVLLQNSAIIVAPDFHYAFYGEIIYPFPLKGASGWTAEVKYSYLPTRFIDLTDTTALTWPNGNEGALIYEVVARLHNDSNRAVIYGKIAATAKEAMFDSVRKRSYGPSTPWTPGTEFEFGGI